MQSDTIEQMSESLSASLRDFKRDAPDQPMNFVAQTQKVLSQVAAVLARYSGNECFLGHKLETDDS